MGGRVGALCFEVLYRSFGAAFRALSTKGVALDPSAGLLARRQLLRRQLRPRFCGSMEVPHLVDQYRAVEAKFAAALRLYEWAAGAAAIEHEYHIPGSCNFHVSHALLGT